MQKVLVVGCCGAGKSTFARALGKQCGLPIIHLDQHYWQSGWTPSDQASWQQRVAELVTGPRWIIDGNYASSLPIRLAAADTVIVLDTPRWQCILRTLWRNIVWAGRTRPDVAEGCPERPNWELLRFIWDFPKQTRPRVFEALESFVGETVVLRNDRDIRAFLATR